MEDYMKKLRYSQKPIGRAQLMCASVLLLTAPQWHWMQCQGPLYDAPVWALIGFTWWRIYRGFSLVSAPPRERPQALRAHVEAVGAHA
jgi:hypothetical protein